MDINKFKKYFYIILGILLIISSFRPEVIRSMRNWEEPRAMGYNVGVILVIIFGIWLIKKGLKK